MKKDYIEKYRNAKRALTEQKKNEVMEYISTPWSQEDIEKYNAMIDMNSGVPYSNSNLTEFQIKLAYLKGNAMYFTREERLELIQVLAQTNVLPRTR